MQNQNSQNLDADRTNGLRPVIVACIIYEKKILFVFSRNYNLWQLPQGGIEPGETITDAARRELTEELGGYAKSIDYASLNIIGSDVVEFPKENQGSRDLFSEQGERIHMKGKKYYFAALRSTNSELPIDESEFEKYRWVSLNESNNLVRHIYQKGKKRITEKALKILNKIGQI